MRFFLHFGLLVLFALSSGAEEESPFKRIFNGKDFTDWDAQPGSWEIRDGAIWCKGTAKSKNWIIWKGKAPENFVLRMKFMWESGNSGVQVRSEKLDDWQVRGYQVEVAQQDKMGLWHHSLLDKEDPVKKIRGHLSLAGERVIISKQGEKKVEQVEPAKEVQSVYKENEWNNLVVICRGPRVIQKINNVVFSDLTDHHEGYARTKGVIAMQDHGKGCVVAFKDIEIREVELNTESDSK